MFKVLSTTIKRIAYCFACLCILFIPFPFYIFPFQVNCTDFVFGKLIHFIARHVFHVSLLTTRVSSDSASFYILVLVLFLFSCLIAAIGYYKRIGRYFTYTFLQSIFSYYLAMQLLKYGADKVFKAQFYLPEPNILYSTFGKLDKDILFWSTMGISRSYNIFLGATEIFAAVLLLFKRTRLIGAIIAVAILCNIVAINFSYDISVKGYSLFLLLLATILALPFRHSLFRYIISQKPYLVSPLIEKDVQNEKPVFFIKAFVIAIIFFEAFYPYIKTGNYNNDLSVKPFLHGAYEVRADSLRSNNVLSMKRFFIHKDGYLIFQNQQDEMLDYKMQVDSAIKQMLLTNYKSDTIRVQYDFNATDSILTLRYLLNDKSYLIQGKQINWRGLPALKPQFHWVSDSF